MCTPGLALPAAGKKVPDYWDASKKLLADPTRFLENLLTYDKDNIPDATIKKVGCSLLVRVAASWGGVREALSFTICDATVEGGSFDFHNCCQSMVLALPRCYLCPVDC